jgi:hypothetical protein
MYICSQLKPFGRWFDDHLARSIGYDKAESLIAVCIAVIRAA